MGTEEFYYLDKPYLEDDAYGIFIEVVSDDHLKKDHIFQSKLNKEMDDLVDEYERRTIEILQANINREAAREKALYEELKKKFETNV